MHDELKAMIQTDACNFFCSAYQANHKQQNKQMTLLSGLCFKMNSTGRHAKYWAIPLLIKKHVNSNKKNKFSDTGLTGIRNILGAFNARQFNSLIRTIRIKIQLTGMISH